MHRKSVITLAYRKIIVRHLVNLSPPVLFNIKYHQHQKAMHCYSDIQLRTEHGLQCDIQCSTTLNFISELGRRICVQTGDARETYLFQRISIMLQRFNSVLWHDTLPVDLPDL